MAPLSGRAAGEGCNQLRSVRSTSRQAGSGHITLPTRPRRPSHVDIVDSLRKIDAAAAAIVAFEGASWHQKNVVAPWIGWGRAEQDRVVRKAAYIPRSQID